MQRFHQVAHHTYLRRTCLTAESIERLTSRRNHVTILELHKFCTVDPELPTYNNLEIKRSINTYNKCVM
jgi:hypothetical protein